MKPLITLLLALSLATTASAQDDPAPYGKGTKLVGFGMNSAATVFEGGGTTRTNSSGVFNLQYGYFLSNGFVVGLDLSSMVSTSETESGGSTTTYETSEGTFGLFTAYYFRFGQKHAIYPEFRVYGGSVESIDPAGDEEWEIGGATLGIGYTYRMNPFIGFDVKLRSGSQTEKTLSSGLEEELGTAQILLGFQIFM
jgi:hypothetical protein